MDFPVKKLEHASLEARQMPHAQPFEIARCNHVTVPYRPRQAHFVAIVADVYLRDFALLCPEIYGVCQQDPKGDSDLIVLETCVSHAHSMLGLFVQLFLAQPVEQPQFPIHKFAKGLAALLNMAALVAPEPRLTLSGAPLFKADLLINPSHLLAQCAQFALPKMQIRQVLSPPPPRAGLPKCSNILRKQLHSTRP